MSCILKTVGKTGLAAKEIQLRERYHIFLFKLYESKMPDTAYDHNIFYMYIVPWTKDQLITKRQRVMVHSNGGRQKV